MFGCDKNVQASFETAANSTKLNVNNVVKNVNCDWISVMLWTSLKDMADFFENILWVFDENEWKKTANARNSSFCQFKNQQKLLFPKESQKF